MPWSDPARAQNWIQLSIYEEIEICIGPTIPIRPSKDDSFRLETENSFALSLSVSLLLLMIHLKTPFSHRHLHLDALYNHVALNADLFFQSHLVFTQIPEVNANNMLEWLDILRTILWVSKHPFRLPHLTSEQRKTFNEHTNTHRHTHNTYKLREHTSADFIELFNC